MFELDHLFICTDVGAPEAESLIQFGLTEGDPNVHPGQGTANRRFFFHNAMLELVWVHDAGEAQSELARPTQLWQRWSQRQASASPFGLCLRPNRPGASEVPFPAWIYRTPEDTVSRIEPEALARATVILDRLLRDLEAAPPRGEGDLHYLPITLFGRV